MAISGVLQISVLLIIFFNMIIGQPREILVDDEGPIMGVAKHAEYENEDNEDVPEHAPCHLEYQVMKRVVGTCIKLGRTARGCVSGNYLQPLHPECM
ncbi:uncharacterized protein LOC111692798 [Anoplophora glabripennis]|uniref:uncharacterized protein LOC111692798 n=1 Tax=Anoplophora glabripennis TaxID=217634 RepID=UPI000C7899B6|nr:uncharacterized protein LOC111692798 [Anoplophora glabripennis]